MEEAAWQKSSLCIGFVLQAIGNVSCPKPSTNKDDAMCLYIYVSAWMFLPVYKVEFANRMVSFVGIYNICLLECLAGVNIWLVLGNWC